MARRTKKEAEETRQAILMSALDIFFEKGYNRTTLADIAEHINLTKGAVYWHFKNKKDLLFCLTKEMELRWDSQLYEQTLSTSTVDDLRNLIRDYAVLFESDNVLHRYYHTLTYRVEWIEELSTVWDYFEKQKNEFLAFISTVLKEEQLKGVVDPDLNPDDAALTLYTIVEGMIVNSLARSKHQSMLDRVGTALDIFFKGIRV